jgi:hypothetical protein
MALKTNNGYLVAPADYSCHTYFLIYTVLLERKKLSLCMRNDQIPKVKQVIGRVKFRYFNKTGDIRMHTRMEPHVGEHNEPLMILHFYIKPTGIRTDKNVMKTPIPIELPF